MALGDYLAREVSQDFADGLLTRREALRRLGLMGVSLSAAAAMLAACSNGDDDVDAGSTTTRPPTSASSSTGAAAGAPIRFKGGSGELQAAYAAPDKPAASVLVVHENRGLTPHFYDLVKRFADEGYAALAVDLLSPEGGTAKLPDEGARQAALQAAPSGRLTGDLGAGIEELQRREPNLKVGVVGFCFGGGMVWNLLNSGYESIAAAAPFYGPAPENPNFKDAKAAVLAVYGELDTFVNPTRDRAEAALKDAGLTYKIRTFAGAGHAFFNDTGQRYNADAAKQAWTELLAWFKQYLA